MNSSNQRKISFKVALGLLGLLLAALAFWRFLSETPEPPPPQQNRANASPEKITPVVKGSASTIYGRLLVEVSGSAESLRACKVSAKVSPGKWVEAEKVSEGRYVFAGRLVSGTSVVAMAPLGAITDENTKRLVPLAHVSQTVILGERAQSELKLELRPAACLTVLARQHDGTEVSAVSVGVDFANEIDAMAWLSLLELAALIPLDTWLTGSEGRRPQVPLVRSGTRLRLTAQSDTRVGASESFDVERSKLVEIVLGDSTSFADLALCDGDQRPVGMVALATTFKGGPKNEALRTGSAQADASGKVRLYGAAGETSVDVSVVSEDWRLAAGSVNVPLIGALHTLVLKATLTVKLEVRFEDDERYVGPLRVSTNPPTGFTRSFEAPGVLQDYGGVRGPKPAPDPTGEFVIRGVPEDVDLAVTAFPQRAGFGYLDAKVGRAELIPNGHYVLKIPRATKKQPSAKIVFGGDLQALSDVEVKVIPVNSSYPAFGPVALKLQKETSLLFPGEYRVELTGTDIAWQSEVLVLKEGETRVVELQAKAAAAAMVTILDADGNAIAGAVLCRHSAMWAEFPARPSKWLAVSDTGGKATLGGFPEGQVELRLEADGFEPEVIQAVLVSGVVTDLGAFRLRPAVGEIRIKIKNFDRIAELKPTIDLLVAGGKWGGQRGRRMLKSGEYSFRNLPLGRTWASVIGPIAGSSWKSINGLRPTEAQPVIEVEVDAAEFDFDD
ncbi:MAG: carboxypeptidase regulatory-like domain-containing protein [Planctomycetes bacterium]|nr:carboxypeptidase regulatory-like domain-containing protein [Planctomycetota bacterium]